MSKTLLNRVRRTNYHPSRPQLLDIPDPTQFDQFLDLVQDIPVFLSYAGQAFAGLPRGLDGLDAVPLRSNHFRDILIQRWRQTRGREPKPHLLRPVLRALEARAHHGEPLRYRHVAVRFHAEGERRGPAVIDPCSLSLDLADPEGRILRIDAHNWQIDDSPLVAFQRPRAMRQLPAPRRFSDPPQEDRRPPCPSPRPPVPPPTTRQELLTRLRQLLQPASDTHFHRLLAWLVSSLHPSGPYPVLALHGPAGAQTARAAHLLRSTLDPAWGQTGLPRTDTALRDAALHNWIVVFDHVRRLSAHIAASLCRLSDGAGFTLRERGDDREPVCLFLRRPAILALDQPDAERPVLRDPAVRHRALSAQLAPNAHSDTDFWEQFEALHPYLLGLLCDAAVTALRRLPALHLQTLPARFPDAAAWCAAAAPALGLTDEQMLAAFDPDPDGDTQLLAALLDFAQRHPAWTGTATELLNQLPAHLQPASPKVLSERLRRLTPQLAAAGLTLSFSTPHGRRLIAFIFTNSQLRPLVRSAPGPQASVAPASMAQAPMAQASVAQPSVAQASVAHPC